MKRLIITLMVLLPPLIGKSQANLGVSIAEIEAKHPDCVFTRGYTNKGTEYIFADMDLGTFFYYIDPSTGLCYLCCQIPFNLTDLNTQVQTYNSKYVITSNSSWTAYLEGGGIIYITLKYISDKDTYAFYYSATP